MGKGGDGGGEERAGREWEGMGVVGKHERF